MTKQQCIVTRRVQTKIRRPSLSVEHAERSWEHVSQSSGIRRPSQSVERAGPTGEKSLGFLYNDLTSSNLLGPLDSVDHTCLDSVILQALALKLLWQPQLTP